MDGEWRGMYSEIPSRKSVHIVEIPCGDTVLTAEQVVALYYPNERAYQVAWLGEQASIISPCVDSARAGLEYIRRLLPDST